jgi:hypothetical protein
VETGNNFSKHFIEDEGLDLNLTPYYHLSIQISLDGFYFCILDSASNKVLALQSFAFQNINDWQTVVKTTEENIHKNKFLKKKYKSTTVSLVSNKYSLIPTPLFDASKQKEYLQLNVETEPSLIIRKDDFKSIDAKILYAVPLGVDLMLRRNFPLCKIVHHLTGLIDSLLLNFQNPSKQVFVNAGETAFDIIITEGKKLIFCNTFSKNSQEDFLYYILFVLEQQRINLFESTITLSGSIEKNGEDYELLGKYIRNLKFAESIDNFQYTYKFNDLPMGSYLSLISQFNH